MWVNQLKSSSKSQGENINLPTPSSATRPQLPQPPIVVKRQSFLRDGSSYQKLIDCFVKPPLERGKSTIYTHIHAYTRIYTRHVAQMLNLNYLSFFLHKHGKSFCVWPQSFQTHLLSAQLDTSSPREGHEDPDNLIIAVCPCGPHCDTFAVLESLWTFRSELSCFTQIFKDGNSDSLIIIDN